MYLTEFTWVVFTSPPLGIASEPLLSALSYTNITKETRGSIIYKQLLFEEPPEVLRHDSDLPA